MKYSPMFRTLMRTSKNNSPRSHNAAHAQFTPVDNQSVQRWLHQDNKPALSLTQALPRSVNNALRSSFGPDIRHLSIVRGDNRSNAMLGSLAHSRGRQISLSSKVNPTLSNPAAMEILGHEVAHALAATTTAPRRLISTKHDRSERQAHNIGQAFRGHVQHGFQYSAPSLAGTDQSNAMIHRFESDEHRRTVDDALLNLLLHAPSGELSPELIDTAMRASSHLSTPIRLNNGLEVTPGDITALMGDFYGAFNEEGIDPEASYRQLNSHFNREEMTALLAVFDRERAGDHTSASDLESITADRRSLSYLELAARNDSHFSAPRREGMDNNMGVYTEMHNLALEAAASGDRNRSYILESMAMHYLTDRHAGGHLINKRGIMEASGHDVGGTTANLYVLFLHNILNENGAPAGNMLGDTWDAYGDANWDRPENAENRFRTATSVMTSWAELDDVLSGRSTLEEAKASRGAHNTVPLFNPILQSGLEDYARDNMSAWWLNLIFADQAPIKGVASRAWHTNIEHPVEDTVTDFSNEWSRGWNALSTPEGWYRLFGGGY